MFSLIRHFIGLVVVQVLIAFLNAFVAVVQPTKAT